MSDPYWRYPPPPPPAERDPRAVFPGYFPSDGSSLATNHTLPSADLRGTSDFLRNDLSTVRSGSYGLDDLAGFGSRATSGFSGLASGASARGFTPLEDPALVRRDVSVGIKPIIPDVERYDPLIKSDGLSGGESNILFVDGLPTDCTRREVAHLFRPFIGFKEIRVVHKEPRLTGDKGHVLCFVEFNDAKCALTALEALQGYRFDDKKADAPILRIQFAKFPFHPPSLRS
ncbi:RNA-binding protein 2-like isoform X2 [Typha latifolia]|uniref:RNA-binding protein 2-like isoform X2 n=1 Tax=Typha latifolia TaxID=4733 RepID=UPI003C2DF86A